MKHDVDDKSDTRMMRHLAVLFLISCALSPFGGTAAGTVPAGKPLAEPPACWNGKEMEIAVPAQAFQGKLQPGGFDFKWEDHALQSYDWTDFTLHGDAAPNDRYNFRALFN